MTACDRDRRHRWAETCDRIRRRGLQGGSAEDVADLRELAGYLRAEEPARMDGGVFGEREE